MVSSNAPAFNLAAGRVPRNVPLTMSSLSGEIWYTTNGVDPRVPFTGTVNPEAVSGGDVARNEIAVTLDRTVEYARAGVPLQRVERLVDVDPGEPYRSDRLLDLRRDDRLSCPRAHASVLSRR